MKMIPFAVLLSAIAMPSLAQTETRPSVLDAIDVSADRVDIAPDGTATFSGHPGITLGAGARMQNVALDGRTTTLDELRQASDTGRVIRVTMTGDRRTMNVFTR